MPRTIKPESCEVMFQLMSFYSDFDITSILYFNGSFNNSDLSFLRCTFFIYAFSGFEGLLNWLNVWYSHLKHVLICKFYLLKTLCSHYEMLTFFNTLSENDFFVANVLVFSYFYTYYPALVPPIHNCLMLFFNSVLSLGFVFPYISSQWAAKKVYKCNFDMLSYQRCILLSCFITFKISFSNTLISLPSRLTLIWQS